MGKQFFELIDGEYQPIKNPQVIVMVANDFSYLKETLGCTEETAIHLMHLAVGLNYAKNIKDGQEQP